MFVELVDHLRCVRAHEETWLVLAARRTVGRHVVDGILGCPLCRAEYPVRDGVADFRGEVAEPAAGGAPAPPPPSGDDVVRLAALLALDDVRAPVVLAGTWAVLAGPLAQVAPAPYVLVNAAASLAAGDAHGDASALLAAGALPLAAGIAHGVALDDAAARDAGLVAGAVRALRARGRLVAPASLTLPDGVRELARDARHWVAERDAAPASAPVPLRRA